MSEVRDPGIKLFGKTILCSSINTTSHDDQLIISEGELTQSKNREDFTNSTVDHESVEPEILSGMSDDTKIQDVDKDPSEISGTEEKVVKKPDKILPCPRCNSMETKFCYYNNYNVNQPRHFCKKCQRYWTAGGTMRNVPVGSGRRKNKSVSTSSYRHIMVSDVLQPRNGNVLAFGLDKPLCDSMASRSHDSVQNGFEQRMFDVCGGKEIGNDRSSEACSRTTLNSTKNGNNFQGFLPQLHHFPGPPWPYSSVPPPPLPPSCFPVSFYPAPSYCNPWNVPWLSPPPSSANCSVHSTSPTSPTLGKHSRDESTLHPSDLGKEDIFQDKDEERSVVIPKTLRIDDLDEVAKSSMWSTLGIKNEKNDNSANGTRLFKAFNSKVDERNHESETNLVLQANPAALSRSHNFQEST